MPQMAPLWWELLFIMFIIMFMIMNAIIYHNKSLMPKSSKSLDKEIVQFKWKW
nr:ATP synthase subunit 8 [Holhymenia tibialis]